MKMGCYLLSTLLLLSFLAFASFSSAEISYQVGICYGQLGNNLPVPTKSVELIKGLKAKRVKIYDANPEILKALEGTDLQVSVMVPNELINNISTNQTLADQWVKTNVVPFYPQTMIRYLLVGNEILSNPPNTTWFNLVPAIRKIRYSVKKFGLGKIKVGTPLAIDVLESSFPPSNGTFRSDVSEKVMKPLLKFLNRTKSFFFFDVYPYFAWAAQPTVIDLDYALLESKNITVTDRGSGLTYTNLLDQMIDAVYFAMKRVGYPDVPLFIAETGWPNAGGVDQIGANIYNAATYNRNVVKKFTAKPPVGTPAKPGVVVPTLLFALYNENQKPGPGTERHFGLLYPNGTNVYGIDLSGKTPESDYKPLPRPRNNEPYKGKIWCVVGRKANAKELVGALTFACGQGNRTCDEIRPGGKCYKPNSLVLHANYAFSSYWAQFKSSGGTCYFNGLAIPTKRNPSYGSCKFPSVTL
ncbi:putative glucan endo-1,3-beta-glucosidase A6 [Capsicum chinense]|nr:putative glucan endo-1,3-beta-glucosidase A6 [Capsicum chinense]